MTPCSSVQRLTYFPPIDAFWAKGDGDKSVKLQGGYVPLDIIQFQPGDSTGKLRTYGIYGNDTWRVNSRLTFNLGLRYEYFGPQKKSEPKYDSNFYYSDPGCSVNSSAVTQLLDCIRGGTVLTSNESPRSACVSSTFFRHASRLAVSLGLGKWFGKSGSGSQ